MNDPHSVNIMTYNHEDYIYIYFEFISLMKENVKGKNLK